MRTLLIVLALLSVTPAMADSVLMAAINRARTEARCPLYPKATAVREVVCDSASAPAECTAGHSDQGHQRVSAMAITGTGSIRQKRSPNGKPFGLGCDRCEY